MLGGSPHGQGAPLEMAHPLGENLIAGAVIDRQLDADSGNPYPRHDAVRAGLADTVLSEPAQGRALARRHVALGAAHRLPAGQGFVVFASPGKFVLLARGRPLIGPSAGVLDDSGLVVLG